MYERRVWWSWRKLHPGNNSCQSWQLMTAPWQLHCSLLAGSWQLTRLLAVCQPAHFGLCASFWVVLQYIRTLKPLVLAINALRTLLWPLRAFWQLYTLWFYKFLVSSLPNTIVLSGSTLEALSQATSWLFGSFLAGLLKPPWDSLAASC